MNERDELIEILHQEATADRVKNSHLRHVPVVAAKVEAAADAILAAGYRKPRTITTVEELDDLGRNAAVLAANGAVLVNDGENDIPWASFAEDALGGPVWIDPVDVKLPATVLFDPEES